MFSTRHLRAESPADVEEAARLLRSGALVAFATETVYGLGANALDAAAVARIFGAKQRPAWDPLIVHVASAEDVAVVADVPPELQDRVARLATAFWPGPLTLLLPRKAVVPDAVTAGRALVGVRVPTHPVARRLLELAGVPVAAPSANTFGHVSPTTAEHVLDDLDGRIDAVLDAGPSLVGVESTVLDPTQTPMVVYRPGAITAGELAKVCNVAVVMYEADETTQRTAARPEGLPSPGVGIRHYAPRARLVLAGAEATSLLEAVQAARQENEALVGVLLPLGWERPPMGRDVVLEPWGNWQDANSLAAGLFAGLRALELAGVAIIVCPLPEAGGIADAVRDRLQKAARAK